MQRPNPPLSSEGWHRQLIQVQTQRDTLGLPYSLQFHRLLLGLREEQGDFIYIAHLQNTDQ